MKFTKMHGCGNDYIYVNGFLENLEQDKKPELARRLSNRNFGIGGDGVIFINPCEAADFEMEMYNADGSRGEMCGNGIRCVAKYVYDRGLTDKTQMQIMSGEKVRDLSLILREGRVEQVRVNMGKPEFAAEKIPVISTKEQVINEPIYVQGKEYKITCVSMGNPHGVVFVEDVEGLDLETLGPCFETHPCFPRRINTEFVRILDRENVKMRVWERGSGETLACGTGCCATLAACVSNGLTDRKIRVKVKGGEILVEWEEKEDVIYMTGPAETVFDGEILL